MKFYKYVLLFFLAISSSKILGVTITFKSNRNMPIWYDEQVFRITSGTGITENFDKEFMPNKLVVYMGLPPIFENIDPTIPITKDSTIEFTNCETICRAKVYETREITKMESIISDAPTEFVAKSKDVTEQKDVPATTNATTFTGSYNNSEFGFGNLSYMCNGKVFPITTGRTAENSYLQTNKIDNLDAACANSGALLLNSDDGKYSPDKFTYIFRNVPLKIGQQNKIEYYAGVPGGFIMIVNGTPVNEGLVTTPPDSIRPGLLWGDSVIRGLSVENPEVIAASSTQPSQIKNLVLVTKFLLMVLVKIVLLEQQLLTINIAYVQLMKLL